MFLDYKIMEDNYIVDIFKNGPKGYLLFLIIGAMGIFINPFLIFNIPSILFFSLIGFFIFSFGKIIKNVDKKVTIFLFFFLVSLFINFYFRFFYEAGFKFDYFSFRFDQTPLEIIDGMNQMLLLFSSVFSLIFVIYVWVSNKAIGGIKIRAFFVFAFIFFIVHVYALFAATMVQNSLRGNYCFFVPSFILFPDSGEVGNYKEFCYERSELFKSIKSNDLNKCLELENKGTWLSIVGVKDLVTREELCPLAIAVNSQEPSFCEKATNKEFCYFNYAVKKNDKNYCKKTYSCEDGERDYSDGWCYIEIAKNLKDENICSEINSICAANASGCYMNFYGGDTYGYMEKIKLPELPKENKLSSWTKEGVSLVSSKGYTERIEIIGNKVFFLPVVYPVDDIIGSIKYMEIGEGGAFSEVKEFKLPQMPPVYEGGRLDWIKEFVFSDKNIYFFTRNANKLYFSNLNSGGVEWRETIGFEKPKTDRGSVVSGYYNNYLYIIEGSVVNFAKVEDDGSIKNWSKSKNTLPPHKILPTTRDIFDISFFDNQIYLSGFNTNSLFYSKLDSSGDIVWWVKEETRLPVSLSDQQSGSVFIKDGTFYTIGGSYIGGRPKLFTVFHSKINDGGEIHSWVQDISIPVSSNIKNDYWSSFGVEYAMFSGDYVYAFLNNHINDRQRKWEIYKSKIIN